MTNQWTDGPCFIAQVYLATMQFRWLHILAVMIFQLLRTKSGLSINISIDKDITLAPLVLGRNSTSGHRISLVRKGTCSTKRYPDALCTRRGVSARLQRMAQY